MNIVVGLLEEGLGCQYIVYNNGRKTGLYFATIGSVDKIIGKLIDKNPGKVSVVIFPNEDALTHNRYSFIDEMEDMSGIRVDINHRNRRRYSGVYTPKFLHGTDLMELQRVMRFMITDINK